MTDNRTTERLRDLLDEFASAYDFIGGEDEEHQKYLNLVAEYAERIEQAIAATLGRPKAKAHPYGYEPDTGAFDCTRCECGCINDISAKYCNDCGGEIEIDMYAEKEIYHCPRHLVFAEKHDDGSLEFDGKRYIAATLGSGTLTAEQVSKAVYAHSIHADCADADWQAIADELNAELGSGTCEVQHVKSGAMYDVWRYTCCGYEHAERVSEEAIPQNFCPNCGKRVSA